LAALAVRDALAGFAVDEPFIKWPNDVHSAQGKLSGILVELKQGHAIVGVGLNVNRPAEGAFEGAGYLSDGAGAELSLEDVAGAVIDSLLTYYQKWCAANYSFAPFVDAYREKMSLLDEHICVRNNVGGEIASGVVQGIDEYGRLLLAGPEGTLAVFAGEITLRGE
jgi:BirA family biotin operon repressor/biotin-[acetyl-CoA-carboxylase] ligase